jgi:hypothetical protein
VDLNFSRRVPQSRVLIHGRETEAAGGLRNITGTSRDRGRLLPGARGQRFRSPAVRSPLGIRACTDASTFGAGGAAGGPSDKSAAWLNLAGGGPPFPVSPGKREGGRRTIPGAAVLNP